MKKLIVLLIFLLPFVLVSWPALAADSVANPIGEAVAHLLSAVVFPVLSAFLLGLIGVVLNKLRTKYSLQISEQIEAKLEQAALAGIALAEEKSDALIKAKVGKLTGKQKLDVAIAHILKAAPQVSRDQADRLVHIVLAKAFGVGATGNKAVE